MKIEHRLSPADAAWVQSAMRQSNEMRQHYLAAMGRVREIELEASTLNRMLETQRALIQQRDRLPESRTPYLFNPEGTALVGESDDTALAQTPQMGVGAGVPAEVGELLGQPPAEEGETERSQTGVAMINGSGAHGG
jgi:hypothetical protein